MALGGSGCPRHLLGKGVHEIESSVSDVRQFKMELSMSQPSAPASAKVIEDAPRADMPPPQSAPSRSRLLVKHDSEMEIKEELELLAQNAKRACAANNIQCADSFTYWIQRFAVFATKHADENLDPDTLKATQTFSGWKSLMPYWRF